MEPLLLLHDALGSKEQMAPLVKALQPGFEVYCMNFSGHGGRPFGEVYGTVAFVGEVLAFMDEHGLERVHIFGYGMGGYVALALASMQPERVNCIYTLGTKFDWTPENAALEAKKLEPTQLEEQAPQFVAALRERHAPNDWKELLLAQGEMMYDLGCRPLLTPAVLNYILHPVMLSVGERDASVSMEETINASDALPHGKFTLLRDCGHAWEQIDCASLATEIRNFLQREVEQAA